MTESTQKTMVTNGDGSHQCHRDKSQTDQEEETHTKKKQDIPTLTSVL